MGRPERSRFARTRRWAHAHRWFRNSTVFEPCGHPDSGRKPRSARSCGSPWTRYASQLSSCCQSRDYLPQSWAGSRWPSPSPSRLRAGKKPGRPRNLAGHTYWWIIKRGGGLENHNEETEHQAYGPAEICKTDRCLHHIAPSGHAFGDPFPSNRHLNVTLREGVFANANQATQISASPGCSSPSVYATPL